MKTFGRALLLLTVGVSLAFSSGCIESDPVSVSSTRFNFNFVAVNPQTQFDFGSTFLVQIIGAPLDPVAQESSQGSSIALIPPEEDDTGEPVLTEIDLSGGIPQTRELALPQGLYLISELQITPPLLVDTTGSQPANSCADANSYVALNGQSTLVLNPDIVVDLRGDISALELQFDVAALLTVISESEFIFNAGSCIYDETLLAGRSDEFLSAVIN